MKKQTTIFRPLRAGVTAVIIAASLSGCAKSAMDLLPSSTRNMLAAEMRLNTSAPVTQDGSISIDELLSRARGPESKAPQNKRPQNGTPGAQESFTTALGVEGVGLEDADKTRFKDMLSDLKSGTLYQIRIDVGSAGGRGGHALVFKTMSDAAALRKEATSVGHVVSSGVDVTLPAGVISIDFIPVSGGTNA